MKIDIFCKVIDNFGDIGVCWRLCQQLGSQGQRVRLVVDDASALGWMAPLVDLAKIEIVTWDESLQTLQDLQPADLVIESFGCELPEAYIAAMAHKANTGNASEWINLEYLCAERYAADCHLLPSPVMHGVGKGLVKTFFYPGFTPRTGGLLREPDLRAKQANFDKAAWLTQQGIAWHGERIVSLFCYEPKGLPALLQELQTDDQPTLLLVTAGRTSQAVQALQQDVATNLRIQYLPYLTQTDYDHLLWASDFNFVRGEDSLVRAIWAGKPFVWQIYPQDDDAHHSKLEAFLVAYLANTDTTTAAAIRTAHHLWNNITDTTPQSRLALDLAAWPAASQVQSRVWEELPNWLDALVRLTTPIR